MLVAPNSDIEFFPDIGLSPGQENTFYFETAILRDAYFASLTPLATADKCSYVRNDPNKIKVAIPIAKLQYAGYMRYKNTAFSETGYPAKWYYAFVTNAEYINNATTEITFERDVMQSWMGEFTLGQCFVEREHTATDAVGEHLIGEDISTGDYTTNSVEQISPYEPGLLISSSVEKSGNDLVNVKGLNYKGYMLSGMRYTTYSMLDGSRIQAALDLISDMVDDNKQDAVMSLRVVPYYCLPRLSDAQGGAGEALDSQAGGTFTSAFTWPTIDGYTPKNNKLFSYPYITCNVINGEGGSVEYRPELFSTPLTASFVYRGVSFDICEVICIPQGYKNQLANYEESIVMRDFPQASFDVDQYKAYVAQMSSGGGWLNVVGSVAQRAAAGALTGGVVGLVAGVLPTILQLQQEKIYYQSIPPAVKGTSNANIMSAMGEKSFFALHKSILAERAETIDNFFTMFGYKVNTVKTPVMNNRPQFTYIKTVDCIVHGNLPASDASEIEAIFNRGIRFWQVPANIGDYSVNNAPAVTPAPAAETP